MHGKALQPDGAATATKCTWVLLKRQGLKMFLEVLRKTISSYVCRNVCILLCNVYLLA